MIKEDIITPKLGKSLTSYHCKTSLFYAIEENDQAIWRPGPEVIKLFSCSTQLRLKFILLINVKMPTIVGILTFMSRINY